jgi:hypothetical protein
MIRQTSIDAYRKIEAEGLLSKLRFTVYDCVFHFGPMTAQECAKKINPLHQKSITPRFSELESMGVLREVGERKCNVTGMTVIEWDVTKNLPEKPKKITKIKCEHCNGKGHFLQERLF